MIIITLSLTLLKIVFKIGPLIAKVNVYAVMSIPNDLLETFNPAAILPVIPTVSIAIIPVRKVLILYTILLNIISPMKLMLINIYI